MCSWSTVYSRGLFLASCPEARKGPKYANPRNKAVHRVAKMCAISC